MKADELIGNELMKEIIAIRIDTLWRMLALSQKGLQPGEQEEGATGAYDNKGALFVPGGMVFDDSDRKPIQRERHGKLSAAEFRKRVRQAMRLDNATLLFPDGIALGVNLDNGFFSDVAAHILAYKKAALKRRPALDPSPLQLFSSDEITRSHTPTYLKPPYGARTKLSSCVSVCMAEPRMYFVACRKEFNLRSAQDVQRVWDDIRSASRPIVGKDGEVLAAAQLVVCHSTRYRSHNLVGITRMLGFGRFGEFATFTLERPRSGLLTETGMGEQDLSPFLFASYRGVRVVGVLRSFPPTQPGKRKKETVARLVAPREDLGIDPEPIAEQAREHYRIPR